MNDNLLSILKDNNLYFTNLKELLEKNKSKRKVKKILETFKCKKNKDIENFLHNNAITFEEKLRARTYLLVQKNPDKEPIIAGYFTIAISVLYAKDIKKEILLKIGNFKSPRDIPCLLIGQFAKSDKFENLKLGEVLMKYALEKLKEVNEIIGSRFILLDAINNEKVIKFYEKFGFIKIEKRKFPLKKSKIKKLKQRKNSIKMIRAFF